MLLIVLISRSEISSEVIISLSQAPGTSKQEDLFNKIRLEDKLNRVKKNIGLC